MPTEPIEERIEVAIAAQLATIQAGTVVYSSPPVAVDYWTTPTVTRELLTIDQYTGAGADTVLAAGLLGVMRASGSALAVPYLDPEVAFERRHVVAVWGYVTRAAGVIAGTKLNHLFDDSVRCLAMDRTLGGLVADLRPDGARDTDDGAREPKAFFRQHWLATVIEDF